MNNEFATEYLKKHNFGEADTSKRWKAEGRYDRGAELPKAERKYLEYVNTRYGDPEAYERWLAAKHPEYKFNGIATDLNYGDKN